MTFNGKISNLWTANMYVAEEMWSLCWTDVFSTVPLYQNKKTAYKILSKKIIGKNQTKWFGMARRTKNYNRIQTDMRGCGWGWRQHILPCHPLVGSRFFARRGEEGTATENALSAVFQTGPRNDVVAVWRVCLRIGFRVPDPHSSERRQHQRRLPMYTVVRHTDLSVLMLNASYRPHATSPACTKPYIRSLHSTASSW